ncbi:hypothetical protein LY90DRAFT_198279 [Neocallimastix californiae]|uniref:Uncharacterized protein n=1 Tax=Neocallimastix californiae TaxID=1754190 RepID=A0A1Y2FPJ4_9FUNG|nr:hypothetical protein LY90DRAFT_198279 [Neocallimastix californiae]|eukprot:ORY85254.1 hypothetical protein LY90DRAFT_198279 [Neocallimastix californiae]
MIKKLSRNLCINKIIEDYSPGNLKLNTSKKRIKASKIVKTQRKFSLIPSSSIYSSKLHIIPTITNEVKNDIIEDNISISEPLITFIGKSNNNINNKNNMNMNSKKNLENRRINENDKEKSIIFNQKSNIKYLKLKNQI